MLALDQNLILGTVHEVFHTNTSPAWVHGPGGRSRWNCLSLQERLCSLDWTRNRRPPPGRSSSRCCPLLRTPQEEVLFSYPTHARMDSIRYALFIAVSSGALEARIIGTRHAARGKLPGRPNTSIRFLPERHQNIRRSIYFDICLEQSAKAVLLREPSLAITRNATGARTVPFRARMSHTMTPTKTLRRNKNERNRRTSNL